MRPSSNGLWVDSMIIERLAVGPLETNCYVVACEATGEAAAIDPGGEIAGIVARVAEWSLRVTWIVNTHGHGDHMAGNRELKAAFPEARLAVHEADAGFLEDAELNLTGMLGMPITSPGADVLLKDGDTVAAGEIVFRVIHVPGHTPGGIALFAERGGEGDGPVVFCGDTIFAGSIGRSDFPGGSQEQLIGAIRRRLLTLPAETAVYPGHGPETMIGHEAATNPFLV